MRGRWANEEYDQLQPTAPGLVGPLSQLAAAQAASCGVREIQLQVREGLAVTWFVVSRSPEPQILHPMNGAQGCWGAAWRLVRGDQ